MKELVIINGKEVKALGFGYDGCHKIYIYDNETDKQMLVDYNYTLLPLSELAETFENSCSLRFIDNADLVTQYVSQFEIADIEYKGVV